MIDLLKGLLEFNPYFRLTAKEALKSPVFDSIRVPYYELPSTSKITQNINGPNCFSYDDLEENKYTVKDYKKILRSEIDKIK